MKILFAPSNIASMPSITANAMCNIGLEAIYLTTEVHQYHGQSKNSIFIKSYAFKKNPILSIYYKLLFIYKLNKYIKWADVVHWTWGSVLPFNLDLKLAKWHNKKRFIEWVGSDIRVPEITMQESKWYKDIFNNGYEYKSIESKEKSFKIQTIFNDLGFLPILVPEMQLFLKKDLFKNIFSTQYRVFEKHKFPFPFFPEIQNEKIRIVHSPSAKFAKGSNFIMPIIEELKKTYPIEFILLHGVSRTEVLETMKTCDIFIDQIILGSYAAAAIEAMSFGKPTIAYIIPSVFEKGIPIDCPIVNANPDTILEVLEKLLCDPMLRHEIGIKSRAFVEKYHDADVLAKQLVEIYNNSKFN